MNPVSITTKSVAAALLAMSVLAGCSKSENPVDAAGASQAAESPASHSSAPMEVAEFDLDASSGVDVDKNAPLDKYVDLNSAEQLLFTHHALSGAAPDYDRIAEALSSEIRTELDQFRKRDLLTAARTLIDEQIESAKGATLFNMVTSSSLGPYDFKTQSFEVRGLDGDDVSYGFPGATVGYRLVLNNGGAFSALKVTDETEARRIESSRATAGGPYKMRVYFAAVAAEKDTGHVRGEITRVELLDMDDKVLYTLS